MIFNELKEPFDENWSKILKIEKERGKRKKKWDTVAQYMQLSEPKGFLIVETDDPALIAKYQMDYGSVLKMKISPIITRSEWEKAIK